jgi:hypothetical protein
LLVILLTPGIWNVLDIWTICEPLITILDEIETLDFDIDMAQLLGRGSSGDFVD